MANVFGWSARACAAALMLVAGCGNGGSSAGSAGSAGSGGASGSGIGGTAGSSAGGSAGGGAAGSSGGTGGSGGGAPGASTLFALAESGLHVVDWSQKKLVRTIALPAVGSSLAVSPDGATSYVMRYGTEIVVVDNQTGAIDSWPGNFGFDLVLSADGAWLYATLADGIAKIDTKTGQMQSLGLNDAPRGIALSADGTRVLATRVQMGLHIVDAASLQPIDLVALTTDQTPPPCKPMASDVVAWPDDSRALIWDENCSNVYQVDLVSRTQLESATLAMGFETILAIHPNRLAVSGGYAWVNRVDSVVRIAPLEPSLSSFDVDFTPWVLTADDGGGLLAAISGDQPTVIDGFSTSGGTTTHTPGLFTLGGAPDTVLDMKLVAASAP